MYSIEVKKDEKIFLVTLSGMISKEEGERLDMGLAGKLKTIKPSEYFVVIDAQELKAKEQDSLDQMKKGIEMFANGSFKGAYNIAPKSAITNSQANRVGKDAGINKIVQVQCYDDAVKLIKAVK